MTTCVCSAFPSGQMLCSLLPAPSQCCCSMLLTLQLALTCIYVPSVRGRVVGVVGCVGATVEKALVVNLVTWECASHLILHVYTYKFCCCKARVTEAVGCAVGKCCFICGRHQLHKICLRLTALRLWCIWEIDFNS